MAQQITAEFLESIGFKGETPYWKRLQIVAEGWDRTYLVLGGEVTGNWIVGFERGSSSETGFSIEEAAEIIKSEREKGKEIEDESFQLKKKEIVFVPTKLNNVDELQDLLAALKIKL